MTEQEQKDFIEGVICQTIADAVGQMNHTVLNSRLPNSDQIKHLIEKENFGIKVINPKTRPIFLKILRKAVEIVEMSVELSEREAVEQVSQNAPHIIGKA